MPRLFAYATLKERHIQDHVLGKDAKVIRQAVLPGYAEVGKKIGDEFYPTLMKKRDSNVNGEILSLDNYQMKKIDGLEDNYMKMPVRVDNGDTTWVYILKPYL